MNSRFRAAEAIFSLLLRAYPQPFRDAFAPELVQFFRDDRARSRGVVGRLGFWWRTLADLLRSAARQRFGSRSPLQQSPAPRKAGPMNASFLDLRFALRSWMRSPGFFAVALATLVLGIAATTAILSAVDGVLLRALPYPDADRLVVIGGVFENDPDDIGPLSEGNLLDLRFEVPAIEAFVAGDPTSRTLLGGGEPEIINTVDVTEGFFELFGVPLAVGRGFGAADHAVGAPRVAVLEHGFWLARWGGDPDVLGESITLDGEAFTIVGVTAAGFQPPEAVSLDSKQLWVPWRVDWRGEADRNGYGYHAVGRLQPGMTAAAASEQIDTVFRRTSRDHSPDFVVGGAAVPLQERTLGNVGEPLRLLLGASAFLLLIACANVANLLLARGTARGKEIALRAALGAGRARIARQLLTESLMLALAAGIGGTVMAYWWVEAFKAISPGGIPRLAEVTVDLRVLALALLLSTATGVLFGLAPVLQSRRSDVAAELKEGGGAASWSRAKGRLRGALVVGEIALAMILMVSAGLLVNSFVQLTRVEAGFEPQGLVSMRVNLRSAYPDRESWGPFFLELLERVQTNPAVTSASLTSSLPFSGIAMISSQTPIAGAIQEPTYIPSTYVSRGHFHNMGMRLLEGRDFSAADHADAPAVAIINEELLEQFWPGADSGVGKRIKMGRLESEEPEVEVVGVVNALRYRPDQAWVPEIYLPVEQGLWRSMTVVARGPENPSDLAPALRQAVWAIDPDIPIDRLATVAEMARSTVVRPRFYSLLAATFALVAMALAMVGIYGTMSYSVGQRRREIGIRMAIGAGRTSVLRMVVGAGARLALAGILLGSAGAWAITRLLERFLFGVSATDIPTFMAAAGLFVATACVACYLPARRASRVDPVYALRADT